MKKKSKYLLAGLSLFFALSTSLNASTIKETTVSGDGYDTINNRDIVVGITRFEGSTVVTGSKVAKATTNDSKYFLKNNNSLDDYTSPVIYVYAGKGGWYSLDDDNNATLVKDSSVISKLENNNIYYVNNIEKKLEINIKGIDIDESSLPNGVTKENDKLLVNATTDNFNVKTTDNITIPYIKNEGKFVIDNSNFYAVDEQGFITAYSGIGGEVEVLSNINGVDIVGIRSGAFDNKKITSVVIPQSIMTIESNAFSNNELTSVIVNEKYDNTDFTSLADDAFGTFTNVKYNNDLTRALNKFKDELKLNVQKDVDLTKELSHISIGNFAVMSEISRIKDDNIITSFILTGEFGDGADDSQNENTIFASMEYKTNDTFNLTLIKNVESQKSVTKSVKYSINKVDGDADYIKNINKLVKDNKDTVSNIKENFVNDRSLKLPSYESVNKLIKDSNLKAFEIGFGVGSDINFENIILSPSSINYAMYSDDILYDSYEFQTLSAVYEFKDDVSNYNSDDEIYEHMIDEFKTKTGITNYEISDIKYSSDDIINKTVVYSMSLTDKANNNLWVINMTSNIPDDYTIVKNLGGVIETHYFPNLQSENYNSTKEWIDAAVEKYKEKSGASDLLASYFGLVTDYNGKEIKYNVDSEGNYNYIYKVTIDSNQSESVQKRWNIYLYKTTKTKIETENYEATETDHTNAINEFLQAKSVTNYKINYYSYTYFKDSESGEFNRRGNGTKYTRCEIYDLDTDKIWYVFIKMTE